MSCKRMTLDRIKELISIDRLDIFYRSTEWRKLRKKAIERDNNECQVCKEKKKVSKAECVHHIREVKEHPSEALKLDNLKSLCNLCHNEIHEKILKINQEKNKKFLNEERW
ncbi:MULTISPECIES: HNH endonuclease signature motif containing protein [Clostridioides]|uniref:HNH endonuclease n=1 Tax=Clostridioides sp. ES-S-0001-03 TaxID=2770771 RepID=UPI0009A7D4D0|nr:HNH endonuclease [Clostridioides sp. ES-S-0001-03]